MFISVIAHYVLYYFFCFPPLFLFSLLAAFFLTQYLFQNTEQKVTLENSCTNVYIAGRNLAAAVDWRPLQFLSVNIVYQKPWRYYNSIRTFVDIILYNLQYMVHVK